MSKSWRVIYQACFVIEEGQRLLLQLVLIDSLNFPICRPFARPKNAPKIWGKARRVQLGQGLI